VGETRGAYRALVVKSEGKNPFEKTNRKWEENNIEMDL
jgi:hypothetical protein